MKVVNVKLVIASCYFCKNKVCKFRNKSNNKFQSLLIYSIFFMLFLFLKNILLGRCVFFMLFYLLNVQKNDF